MSFRDIKSRVIKSLVVKVDTLQRTLSEHFRSNVCLLVFKDCSLSSLGYCVSFVFLKRQPSCLLCSACCLSVFNRSTGGFGAIIMI